jgi:hypothetical protein
VADDLRVAYEAERARLAGNGDDPATFDDPGYFAALDADPEAGGRRALLPQPIDWAELFARDRASEDWLIPDVWPKGRMISLTAPRKERKSLLMLYLAACLAVGRNPWTQRTVAPVPVAYLDFEMTEDDLLERVEDMGFTAADLGQLHYFLRPELPMLDQPEGGKMLVELIDAYAVKAIVIDTFSRVVSTRDYIGHEVREFYRWSAQHVKARGVSLARLDHTGHGNTDRAAGTASKGADVDVGWVIHPGERDSLSLKHHGLTRVRWVPDIVDLAMLEEPLRFARAHHTWAPGTAECAADLDALGLPLDVSANAAQKALRDAGKGRKRNVVLDAVGWRREPAQAQVQLRLEGRP